MIWAAAIVASLMIAQSVSADAVADKCKNQFYQQTAAALAKKPRKPGSPRNLADEVKLEKLSPSVQMLKSLAIESCILRDVSVRILNNDHLSTICEQSDGHKLSCFHDWLIKREFAYSAMAAIYLSSATSLAEKDKVAGLHPDIALVELIDAAFIPLEHLDESKNATFRPIVLTAEMRKSAADFGWPGDPITVAKDEQSKLQKVEREVFAKAKNDILGAMQRNLAQLRGSKTAGAALPNLEKRLKVLQAKTIP